MKVAISKDGEYVSALFGRCTYFIREGINMPRGDRTRPRRKGLVTGRGIGGCIPIRASGSNTVQGNRFFGGIDF